MAINKAALPTELSQKTITGLIPAKLIHEADAYKHGSITVVELIFSDLTSTFIKVGPNGAIEIGGTLEMGSGTRIAW